MKETVSGRKQQDWDNKKKLRRIWLFLFLFTLCLVWGNSLLSREDSGAVSDWVRQLLETIFGNETPAAQFILVKIRKIAHFLEYSMLGIEAVLFTFLARPVSGQGVFNCTAGSWPRPLTSPFRYSRAVERWCRIFFWICRDFCWRAGSHWASSSLPGECGAKV